MTNEERLAIAEELAGWALSNHDVNMGDVALLREANKWRAYGKRPGIVLAESEDAVLCIHQARQKLAAEREAKKSEREKRLEKLLYRMIAAVEMSGLQYMLAGISVDDAREALKED